MRRVVTWLLGGVLGVMVFVMGMGLLFGDVAGPDEAGPVATVTPDAVATVTELAEGLKALGVLVGEGARWDGETEAAVDRVRAAVEAAVGLGLPAEGCGVSMDMLEQGLRFENDEAVGEASRLLGLCVERLGIGD
jgi:hypothetical protein